MIAVGAGQTLVGTLFPLAAAPMFAAMVIQAVAASGRATRTDSAGLASGRKRNYSRAVADRRNSSYTHRVERPRAPMIDIHIRISRRLVYAVLAFFVGLLLLSWGFGIFGRSSSGGIELGPVQPAGTPLATGLSSIRRGMTKADVLRRLGRPAHTTSFGGGNPEVCWSYPASTPNTSIDARTFCFRRSRVVRILTGFHG